MPTIETRRPNPVVLLGIVLAVIALVIVGIRTFTRETVEIRAAAVNHQNLLSTVSTNGRVEPVEYFQAHALAPGTIAKIYVEVGQRVKSGRHADPDGRRGSGLTSGDSKGHTAHG